MAKLVSHLSRAFFVLFFLAFFFPVHAEEPVFQFVRAFGDERENYLITKTGGIAINDKKEIFIIDRATFSLLRYDWNGAFIARTGQKGQGPGDFITPAGIQYLNHKLFIYDWLNRRMGITDSTMKKFDYFRIKHLKDQDGRLYTMRTPPIVLDGNRFLGVNDRFSPEKGRLFIFDKKQRVNTYFFCDLPTNLKDEMWRLKANEDTKFLFDFCTYPIVGVNHQKKQMLITFERPDPVMRFYLYSFSGELIRHFTCRQDEKFRFPMPHLDSLKYEPPNYTVAFDIITCKDYYLVYMLQVINNGRPDVKSINSYLIVNTQGEVLRQEIENVRYLTATPDGYLGGIDYDDEDDLLRIIISRLNTDFLSKQKPITSISPLPVAISKAFTK